MAKLIDAQGNLVTADPVGGGDPTKVHYAIYLDDQGKCVGIEHLAPVVERKITTLQKVFDFPQVAEKPIYQIWVQATADLGKGTFNAYKTCYSGGMCFRC